jgi:hypothetical protein
MPRFKTILQDDISTINLHLCNYNYNHHYLYQDIRLKTHHMRFRYGHKILSTYHQQITYYYVWFDSFQIIYLTKLRFHSWPVPLKKTKESLLLKLILFIQFKRYSYPVN